MRGGDWYGISAETIDGIDQTSAHGRAYGWATITIHFLIQLFRRIEDDQFQYEARRLELISTVNTLIRFQRLGEQFQFCLFDWAHPTAVEVLGLLHRSYFNAVRVTLHGALCEIAESYLPDWEDMFPSPDDALARLGILPSDKATVERIVKALYLRWGLTPAEMCKELWRIEASLLAECKAVLEIVEAKTFADSARDEASRKAVAGKSMTANEDRDRWIYLRCCAMVKYATIAARLRKKRKWEPIDSISGIKVAAQRYAKRHGLPPIPGRQPGRPSLS